MSAKAGHKSCTFCLSGTGSQEHGLPGVPSSNQAGGLRRRRNGGTLASENTPNDKYQDLVVLDIE